MSLPFNDFDCFKKMCCRHCPRVLWCSFYEGNMPSSFPLIVILFGVCACSLSVWVCLSKCWSRFPIECDDLNFWCLTHEGFHLAKPFVNKQSETVQIGSVPESHSHRAAHAPSSCSIWESAQVLVQFPFARAVGEEWKHFGFAKHHFT